MLKRTICILAMLVCFSQSCFAQDIVFQEVKEEKHTPLGGVLFETGEVIEVEAEYSVSFFNDISFDEYIAGFVLNSKQLPEVISGLAQFNITKDAFTDLYFDAVLKHPEILIRTKYTTIGIVEGTNIVEWVEPVYLVDTIEDANEARQQMEAAVKEYTDLANKYDTDVEKLLVIHDKMVADCTYDVRVLDESTAAQAPYTVYHALGVLRDEFAVCQGYSQALYMIAKELGIELDFCYSEKINHMWNYVNLDGKWYHMDMTNDDPADVDAEGNKIAREDTRACHYYFLVSDTGLNAEAHGDDWRRFGGETYKCSDTRYESDHLFNVLIPFTAQRQEDGYFHVLMPLTVPALGINTTVDFKSRSLYTGSVIPAPCITNGKYTVEENGVEVEKEGTNLYLIQYATRDIPSLRPIVQWENNQIQVLEVQKAFLDNGGFIKLISADVEENRLPSFTAFLWDASTLTPYAMKTTWSQQ